MSPKPKSPLAKVRNPEGRVDLLIARLIAETVRASKNPLVPAAYAEVQPLFETLLTQKLGPKTRRGRKLAKDLFTLRGALQNVRRSA